MNKISNSINSQKQLTAAKIEQMRAQSQLGMSDQYGQS